MKNKLLKTLSCFAGISAIGSTTAIVTTSCGSSNQKCNPLPEEVYDIDENTNTLNGFKDDFLNNKDSEIYKDNFKNCNTLKIPSVVTEINSSAFSNTGKSLIPDYIKKILFTKDSNCSSIKNAAFTGSSLVESVILSSSLLQIDSYAFKNCSSITSIDFSNCTNLSFIGNNAFSYCPSIKSISFSSGLKTISDEAFYECSSIDSIDLSNCPNLSSIGYRSFGNCSSIKDIKINNDYYSVQQMGTGKVVKTTPGWDGTTRIIGSLACGDISFDDYINLSTISGYAFQHCASITSVDLSKCTSPYMEDYAFYGCTSIKDIKVNPNYTSSYHMLQLGNGKVIVSKNQTTWGENTKVYASLSCGDIEININSSQLGNNAFMATAITSLDLSKSSSIERLESKCCCECANLKTVILDKQVNYFGEKAFQGCKSLNQIVWSDGFAKSSFSNLGAGAFTDLPISGKIIINGRCLYDEGNLNSLLQMLKSKGLPEKWTIEQNI